MAGEESLLEHLRQARRRRFIGRRPEIDELIGALAGQVDGFSVMFVHGPGGIGKTTLLEAMADEAEAAGATVIRIDAHRMRPTSSGVVAAMSSAVSTVAPSVAAASPDPVAALWNVPRPVLLVDGYELLDGIDTWFREQFMLDLPTSALVVVASRRRPAPQWAADPAWRNLLRIVRLPNLSQEDTRGYLEAEGVPEVLWTRLIDLSHGHPLTLSLLVDTLHRRQYAPDAVPRRLDDVPEVVQALLAHMLGRVPSTAHRAALGVVAHARFTTEDLLRSVLGEDRSSVLFGWLRELSFIEEGPFGLYPTDPARDVLEAEHRWRDRDGYADLHQNVRRYVVENVRVAADARETQRRIMDAIFVARSHPVLGPGLRWPNGRGPYLERVRADDRGPMVGMAAEHLGSRQAVLLDHWLTRQPEAFRVFRGDDGKPRGFGGYLALHEATSADIEADPGARAMWEFAQRAGSPRPGQAVMAWRFLVDCSPSGLSPIAAMLAAMARVEVGLSRSRWSWDLVGVVDDVDSWRPIMGYLDFSRAAGADYEIDGRTFAVFAHDWRLVGMDQWLEITAARELGAPVDPPSAPSGGHVLSESEFAAAVRAALRDLHSSDLLTTNPLLGSQVVRARSRTQPAESALREVLLNAVDVLRMDPRRMVLFEVADHAFVRPDPTHGQAAAALRLPLSTYRRHREQAVQRITNWLWIQELEGVAAE
ncbi:AAA family ATPase [Actinomycetes bacterium KLBMP 9759]